MLRFAALFVLFAAVAGQSDEGQVNSNFFWYCVTWQNTQGTDIPPDSLYSMFSISAGQSGFTISDWSGDAPEPDLADLMTLNPGDVDATIWEYGTWSVLSSQKLPTVTNVQAASIPSPQTGMAAYNGEGSIIVYTGSEWVTLATA
ncbi:MAG TPA: hypothetical protein VNI01_15865 [Elusimicrobiota bacterium]|jgi:hypothetical protein|nr:hypothetical protein [Elusimicrobiota bacterium]